MDLLVLGFALALPVLLMTSPMDDPGAWPWLVIGVCLLPAAPYTITAWAGARAALTRLILAPRDGERPGADRSPGLPGASGGRLRRRAPTDRA